MTQRAPSHDRRGARDSLNDKRAPRTAAILLAALAGIVLAAAITWSTSQLVRQRIGLASEPLTAGSSLMAAPSAPSTALRGAPAKALPRTASPPSPSRGGATSQNPPPARPEPAPAVERPATTPTSSGGETTAQPAHPADGAEAGQRSAPVAPNRQAARSERGSEVSREREPGNGTRGAEQEREALRRDD